MISLFNNKTEAAIIAATVATAYILHKAFKNSRKSYSTRSLRGPPSPSFLTGHQDAIIDYDIDQLEGWLKEYGSVFRIDSYFPFESKGLCVVDPKAVAFITSRSLEFSKPRTVTQVLMSWGGLGLFTAEGEAHKKQRRMLGPCFSAAQTKSFDEIMVQKAHDMRDLWISELQDAGIGAGQPLAIDVLDWLERATLDVIGVAGFGYHFGTLQNTSNELAGAIHELFGKAIGLVRLISLLVPGLSWLPTERGRAAKKSVAIMRRIGTQLVDEKKAEIERLAVEGEDPSRLLGRDLLDVLVKDNMKESEAQKLPDEEVLAQIATFILAGHETASAALSWTLYALAKDPTIQTKLREELMAFPNSNPSSDDLHSLPYLDCVLKESLRRYSPAVILNRTALHDMVVPLGEPVVDKHGNPVHELFVKAGEPIIIWTAALNCSTKWWGPDAHEFRPERFMEPLPPAVAAIPSIYSSLASFGAGSRACIGWRFALIKLKAILFVLVRTFDFDIDPALMIKSRATLVSRPSVEGQEGNRLPLKVSLHSAES